MTTPGTLASVVVISLGACVGALSRWQLGVWLNTATTAPFSFPSAFPVGTLVANLIGGYLVGVCLGVFQLLPNLDPMWRLLLVTGFLGALTTFSSFSAEVVAMLAAQQYGLAVFSSVAHLLGSLMATVLGLTTVKWVGTWA